jgi:3' terminal RNA ribose 2'-O-methyltransferase Hen1
LAQYVNDRPYVASSFLSVAIAKTFGSSLSGKSKERQELVDQPLDLEVALTTLPCRGGEGLLRRLFEPLGYEVSATSHLLDLRFPEWGDAPYISLRMRASVALRNLLTHIYVLIPVLDDEKHYWVSDDEVEKLLRYGEKWLSSHPERETIARRYLRHQRSLVRQALSQLADEDNADPDEAERVHAVEESVLEEKISLNEQRLGAVMSALRGCNANSVLDLGCGEGKLLRQLLEDSSFTEIVGMDVSYRSLEIATDKLHLDRLPSKQRERIRLIQGSLIYRDRRLHGFDGAAVVEVIEHLDAPRLAAFERVLFEFAKPTSIVVTTPNVEYNVKFENLPAGKFRHKDHRFEWTRQQFREWASAVAGRFGYSADFVGIGPEDPAVGTPTQMAIFRIDSTN